MASAWEQLGSIAASFGPVGTELAIAALPVVTGAAIFITKMGAQAKIDRLEGEVARLTTKSADDLVKIESKYSELDAKYQRIVRSGALIQSQLDAIASEIADLALRLNASDYAVLIPAPTLIPGDIPEELVFLCASGPQSATLKFVRVPVSSSLSGEAYASGAAKIGAPSPSAGFAERTDKLTNVKTNDSLSVCLKTARSRVGVAQFLNKQSGHFDFDDAERALSLTATLAIRVGDFVADPRAVIELGYAPRRNQYRISCLFVDLTNFSSLFGRLDNSVIADLLNHYFQTLCDIAIKRGATIDQFIGDGMLLIFNSDQQQSDHEASALAASREMLTAFRSLRRRWVTLGYGGTESIYVRFGLSSGVVTRTEIGHLQARRVTVIGPAVNAAAHACEQAPRGRDTLCLTPETYNFLSRGSSLDSTPIETQGATIYEIRA